MFSDLLGCHACLNVLHHYLLHNFIFSYSPHRATHFFCQLCYFFFCKAFYYLHSLIFCAGLSLCWLNLSYFVIRLLASCNSLSVCHAIIQLSCIVVYDCKLLMKVIFKHCDCMTFVFYFFDDVLNFCFHIFLLLCRAFALLFLMIHIQSLFTRIGYNKPSFIMLHGNVLFTSLYSREIIRGYHLA